MRFRLKELLIHLSLKETLTHWRVLIPWIWFEDNDYERVEGCRVRTTIFTCHELKLTRNLWCVNIFICAIWRSGWDLIKKKIDVNYILKRIFIFLLYIYVHIWIKYAPITFISKKIHWSQLKIIKCPLIC